MRTAMFTNILTPYRISFFDAINSYSEQQKDEFRVFAMSDTEGNRTWQYEEFKREYTTLLPHLRCKISKSKELHFNTGIKKILEEYRPDVVIAAGSYIEPTVIRLAQMKKKYKYRLFFWSESHLNEVRSYGKCMLFFRKCLRENIYKKMDGFWYPGEKAREFIEQYKAQEAEMIQVPNTVDDVFFEIQGITAREYEGPCIIFTPARLQAAKGILEFCEILKEICPDRYRWYIAGDGELKTVIEEKIKKYNLSAVLLGNQPPEVIRDYYKKSNLFLLPSIADPSPLTCIEALWSGLPLFVSGHVGNGPEVVREGLNGFIFSYSDPASAVRDLSFILDQNAEWFEKAAETSFAIADISFRQRGVAERTMKQMKQFVLNQK